MYKQGDVVFWSGFDSTFGVINKKSDYKSSTDKESDVRWILDVPDMGPNRYDACHEMYLRLATNKERQKFYEKYPEYKEGLPTKIFLDKINLNLP